MKKVFKDAIAFSIIIISFAFVSFGTLTFLAACNNEVINSYEYIEDGCYYYESHNGISEYYATNKTVTDYATYSFDERISLAKRNRFVTFTEQILDYLSPEELPDKWLVFFISEDIKMPRAETEDYNIFCSTSNTKTIELIGCVIQALETNTLNYGLVYGVSSKIYSDLGWGKTSTPSDSKIRNFLKKDRNSYILDLTYPVFNAKFSSKEQIKYAKYISIKLTSYIEQTHGEQAFSRLLEADKAFDLSFDNLFYGYLNEWLDTINIAHIAVNSEVMKFVPYTTDFPIRILTVSCDYYMDKDWNDTMITTFYEYKDFKFDYSSVKDILHKSEPKYELVKDFFEYTSTRKYPVLLQNIAGNFAGQANKNYIIIDSMQSLVHEYAHFTSFVKFDLYRSWMLEAIAHYCQIAFDDFYPNAAFFSYYNREEYEKVHDLPDSIRYVFDNYMDISTNENYWLRLLEGLNYARFCEGDINLHESFDEYINTDYRYFSVSFSDYLIKTYGKEKYIDLYSKLGNLQQVYEKTQTEMIDDYLSYLENIFE